MRFSAAYYLLMLYCTVILRAALPLVSDLLSHEFEEQIHLATVHAKYGNNHLQAEVADTAATGKDANALKSQDTAPVHLLVVNEKNIIPISNTQKSFSTFADDNLPLVNIAAVTPPPKSLV